MRNEIANFQRAKKMAVASGTQAFQNFILCLILTIIQKSHRNLQIIPHSFLSYDAAVNLFL